MTESAGRKLVLLRHAKSAWPDLPDHERPLAGRGRRDAPVMGRWLRAAGHVPDQVLCSTARRTRETWQLAQPGLGAAPPVSFEDQVYEASAAQLLDLARRAPPAAKTLLIVGHDPGIPGWRSWWPEPPRPRQWRGERRRATGRRRPHEGKVPHRRDRGPRTHRALDQLGPGTARLTAFVTPRDLKASAS